MLQEHTLIYPDPPTTLTPETLPPTHTLTPTTPYTHRTHLLPTTHNSQNNSLTAYAHKSLPPLCTHTHCPHTPVCSYHRSTQHTHRPGHPPTHKQFTHYPHTHASTHPPCTHTPRTCLFLSQEHTHNTHNPAHPHPSIQTIHSLPPTPTHKTTFRRSTRLFTHVAGAVGQVAGGARLRHGVRYAR